jgi:hypothetical protein
VEMVEDDAIGIECSGSLTLMLDPGGQQSISVRYLCRLASDANKDEFDLSS